MALFAGLFMRKLMFLPVVILVESVHDRVRDRYLLREQQQQGQQERQEGTILVHDRKIICQLNQV
ncbi:MAG: hypothetical protein H6R04_1058 [Burkholderiaceae bacterium]|nr:hypothetical protein [Burkholderiaceae bacterium]